MLRGHSIPGAPCAPDHITCPPCHTTCLYCPITCSPCHTTCSPTLWHYLSTLSHHLSTLSHPSTSYLFTSHKSKSDQGTEAAITIIEYSIDPVGMKPSKPSSVCSVDTLLRVCDVFVSTFSTSDGGQKRFNQLSKIQKVKVFQSTWSTPSIKIEQIRVYYNFALFCLKQMLECYPKEAIPTIKEYIFTLCELHFGGNKSNWGSITVSGLLQVCLVFF